MSATQHPNLAEEVQAVVDEYRQETAENRQPGHCRRGHFRSDVMCPTEYPCYWCEYAVPSNVPGGRGPAGECLEHLGEEVTS